MARMRRGGSNSSLVLTLVAFVIVALVATILCVISYANANKQEIEKNDKAKTLERYVKSGERAAFEAAHADVPAKESYTAHLESEIRDLKRMATGSDNVALSVIDNQWATDLPEKDKGTPLFAYIHKLQADNQAAADSLKQKDADLAKAQADILAAQNESKDASEKFTKAEDDQGKTVKTMDSTYQGEITKLKENLDTLAKSKDQNLTDALSHVKQLDNDNAQKDQEIHNLQQRIRELMPKRVEATAVPDTSLQAKGSIVSILEDANLVYIDRGRKQHVVPGLTFEVFDRSTGVTKDEHGELRGKATIEVINVSEDSSVCRIVRHSPRTTLIEGDILANAVYDPNYKFKFVVFGDFDIDGTGQATQADKQRIKTTIAQWGGTVTDELSYDTDFLVLGQEPKFPDALPPNPTDPTAITRHANAVQKYNEYQNLIKQAKGLSIPILNQNRFLALVGYYKR